MEAPSIKHKVHGWVFILANRLQAQGDCLTGELTSRQWFLLLALGQADKPVTTSQLAQEIGTSRQNAAKLLSQLEGKGYVVFSENEDDRRSQLVQVTEKAKPYLKKMSEKGKQYIDLLFKDISDAEINGMISVFQKLVHNIELLEHSNLIMTGKTGKETK